MNDWPELNSPEDADATHRWARACLEMWEAERKQLRTGLGAALAALEREGFPSVRNKTAVSILRETLSQAGCSNERTG